MFNKKSPFTRQFFTSEEIDSSKTFINQEMAIEANKITGKNGLVIDGHIKGFHISTLDKSPIIISAMAVLEDCVIVSPDILIEGKFKGTIVAEGQDGEDVAGRLEFGSGAQVFGVVYASENIVQTKGLKVVMDIQQRPFDKYVAKSSKSDASLTTEDAPATSVTQLIARQSV